MSRVRPEAPSFRELARCLGAEPKVKLLRKGSSLCAGYSGCSFYVERKNAVTPGGVKLLARWAKRGVVKAPDERRAMLFLYGKDLFEFELVEPPCERGYVLVYWDDVLLGLGMIKKGIVLNLLDFGEFLRRGY
ncbi:hypothetical protein [Ignicoccus hospitalis]|uniref:UPF0113 domain-containing protein n=1 Tax=Ignicoccus hospitalis (strain KIN4/I / DSM 18386 / JCM 14125) TaxID=453591 RepID=A8AAR5_IGNH4|nr:hypothetical protein [Ignicoccus hospitalis]ABU82017.1 hypothetical protein Igni_0835 [Ignicoccus hospitalis KIN4/I]